ncbi:hypothetical protein [Nocardia crassostreae]|uniref:hypothetical protein n=1 Tax=Nocardia crassostreae TaxID=53428 RepID=UPI000A66496E|nr:hypothetical protein [Nocardia crassostreae]
MSGPTSSALLNTLTGTGPAPADVQAGNQALQQAAQTAPDSNAAVLGALTNTQIQQHTLNGDATITVTSPGAGQGNTPPTSAGSETGGGPTSSALLNALTGTGPAPVDVQAGNQALQQAAQTAPDSNAAILGALTDTQIQQRTTTTGESTTTTTAVTGPYGHTWIGIAQRPASAPPSSPQAQKPTDPKAQATRDWLNEMWQLGVSATRFQTNLTGGGGWQGFTDSWSTLGRGVTEFGRTWSGSNPQPRADSLADLGSAVIRLDDLKEHGPEFWQTKLKLDFGAGVPLDGAASVFSRGATAAADAAENAAAQAGKNTLARTAADDAAALQAGKDAGQQSVDNPTLVVKSDRPEAPTHDDPPASGGADPSDADRPDRAGTPSDSTDPHPGPPPRATAVDSSASEREVLGDRTTSEPQSDDVGAAENKARSDDVVAAENEAAQILGPIADRVVGINEWATRHSTLANPYQIRESLNEVRELRRQLDQSPASTGTPALDHASIAPKHPATGEQLSEFDIGIMQPGHSEISHRVEVKTVTNPLESSIQLNDPVKATIDKVITREKAGTPIATSKELNIYATVKEGSSTKKGIITVRTLDGSITRTRLNGIEVGKTNIFGEYEDLLNRKLEPSKRSPEYSDKIDKITIVNDANPGEILAVYTRQDSGWRKTK